jgi:N-methylhydantoinase B/oxoprolinase/acetone carboxylase alpha subunit
VALQAGDVFVIQTPGGGGFGASGKRRSGAPADGG